VRRPPTWTETRARHRQGKNRGLQARLRQLGVAAVVDYVPNGKLCREPRATCVPEPDGLLTDGQACASVGRPPMRIR
jgi:hypothetical protein